MAGLSAHSVESWMLIPALRVIAVPLSAYTFASTSIVTASPLQRSTPLSAVNGHLSPYSACVTVRDPFAAAALDGGVDFTDDRDDFAAVVDNVAVGDGLAEVDDDAGVGAALEAADEQPATNITAAPMTNQRARFTSRNITGYRRASRTRFPTTRIRVDLSDLTVFDHTVQDHLGGLTRDTVHTVHAVSEWPSLLASDSVHNSVHTDRGTPFTPRLSLLDGVNTVLASKSIGTTADLMDAQTSWTGQLPPLAPAGTSLGTQMKINIDLPLPNTDHVAQFSIRPIPAGLLRVAVSMPTGHLIMGCDLLVEYLPPAEARQFIQRLAKRWPQLAALSWPETN
jgi:hypothetical protein